jgi:hypothetical protein
MPALMIETPPVNPAVALDEMKNYLRVEIDDDDDLITGLITAATEACQVFTARAFITTGYVQCLDSFPYFADTQLSQNAMPPSYYSLPLYSTTLWNYSQQIKLFRPPLQSIGSIMYMASADSQWHALVPVPQPWYPLKTYSAGSQLQNQVADGNGNIQQCITPGKSAANPPAIADQPNGQVPNPGYSWGTELGDITTETGGLQWQNVGPVPVQDAVVGGSQSTSFGSFILDTNSEPARLFPGPAGNYWPPVLYFPNAIQIHFTAGFGDDSTDIPLAIHTALMCCVSDYYENRVPVEKAGETLPGRVKQMLWPWKVLDICPTRG